LRGSSLLWDLHVHEELLQFRSNWAEVNKITGSEYESLMNM